MNENDVTILESYGAGVADERERIIGLIENSPHYFWVDTNTDELIALIKGGN